MPDQPRLDTARREELVRLLSAIDSLFLFRGVFDSPLARAWRRVVTEFLLDDPRETRRAFSPLFGELARAGLLQGWRDQGCADLWKSHLIERILGDENPLSEWASRSGGAEDPDIVPHSIQFAARSDLAVIELAARLTPSEIARLIDSRSDRPLLSDNCLSPLTEDLAAFGPVPPTSDLLAERFAASENWSNLVTLLISHYRRVGVGPFAHHIAFRWANFDNNGGNGSERGLVGIDSPDPITLAELIGYDAERAIIIRNTEHLLAGFRANNCLLYGDRGTGKSSTVKALLNAYAARGLRLIELSKDHLADYPILLSVLRQRPEKFVLFVDDLSFDETETEFKALKAMLEGGIEERPKNVAIYATSNRRHLVSERHSDRGLPGDELRSADTQQEKLSLSDRFGITATFFAPDKKRYLEIVRALAVGRGIGLPENDLFERAEKWESWQNGRSGRSARQFVDYLEGEIALDARVGRS